MSRVVALVVALLLSPAFLGRSGAAQLAPKRASDLRTVDDRRRHACPNLLLGFALDTELRRHHRAVHRAARKRVHHHELGVDRLCQHP